MRRFRVRAAVAALVVGGLALTLRGQTAGVGGLQIQNVGLPAVDEGLIQYAPRLRDDNAAVGSRVRPGRVIVRFRDDVAIADRRAAVREANSGAEIAARPSYADFDIVTIDASDDPEATAAALRGRPDVQYAQAANRVHATLVPNDPLYLSQQWNLPLINMEKAWDIQPQAGSAITVAVIDSGMAYTNVTINATLPAFRDSNGRQYPALGRVTIPYSAAPQLVSAASAGRIVAPHDFVNETSTPLDFEGHGTHVSGTIGQLTNDSIGTAGIAYNVKLMPVKVLASEWDLLFAGFNDISFTGGTDDDVARGIRYAADNGAKVLNLSLGSSGPADCATNANQAACSPVIEAAMRYAVGKGCFITVAAGNEFEDTVPPFGKNPTSVLAEIASRINGVVSVASIDKDKGHAFYSSTGSYIELSAPGGSSRTFPALGVVQQTFDSQFHRHVSAGAGAVPRAAVRHHGLRAVSGHVDGRAACRRRRGDADAAGGDRPGGDRRDPREDRC